jgi:hypothetical protein
MTCKLLYHTYIMPLFKQVGDYTLTDALGAYLPAPEHACITALYMFTDIFSCSRYLNSKWLMRTSSTIYYLSIN